MSEMTYRFRIAMGAIIAALALMTAYFVTNIPAVGLACLVAEALAALAVWRFYR